MKIDKLPEKLLLQNADILDPINKTNKKGDVLLVNGVIADIGKFESPKDIKTIDCVGLTLTQGFCDLHVHFREPGNEDKETLESGSKAALAGGFTRVCTMPNTAPPIDSPESISYIIEKAKKCPIHIHPIGAVTKGQKGHEISEMGLMKEAGAIAFSDDGIPIQNGLVMRKALEYSKMLDVPVINHAEDDCLRCDGVMNEGLMSTRLGLSGNPSIAESTMVHRDLKLAGITGAKLHVPHVSTAASVEHIREMKNTNNNISAEVTPHHLFFNDESLYNYDTSLKVAPPIRGDMSRKALIEGILDGAIDCIATDHAPHTLHDKETTFDLASFGMIGLESCFGIVKKILVDEEGLSLIDFVELLTVSPRKIMGLDYDLLSKGKEAEIVLFDSNKIWTFEKNNVFSRSINSPFYGKDLSGKVRYTISKGYISQV
ncbi:MAG: dihydroorotase [Candidatus Marinimicrobia bacterium]|nr:dihydroorotase [Candidatus Neomarinimicrobiota bacterium]|tara:strand:+ start:45 stop:1334 length:1290 start_codon:yes stop_codon:yes gene_type:complete